jgi:hypothetical protein
MHQTLSPYHVACRNSNFSAETVFVLKLLSSLNFLVAFDYSSY